MKTGWKTFGALLLATFFVGPVQAEPISLEDLLGGDTITVGDKLFSGWEFIWSDGSEDALVPDLASIMISGLDGDLDPGPGLRFDFGGVFTFDGDDSYAYADLAFGFFVDVLDPGLQVKDVSMTTAGSLSYLGGEAYSDLGWAVIEDVFDDTFGDLGSLYANFDVLDGDLNSAPNAGSADFAGQDSIWVELNIFAFATELTDSVNLETMDVRFSQEAVTVPEPGTLALLGIGLLGMAATRRRRQKI